MFCESDNDIFKTELLVVAQTIAAQTIAAQTIATQIRSSNNWCVVAVERSAVSNSRTCVTETVAQTIPSITDITVSIVGSCEQNKKVKGESTKFKNK